VYLLQSLRFKTQVDDWRNFWQSYYRSLSCWCIKKAIFEPFFASKGLFTTHENLSVLFIRIFMRFHNFKIQDGWSHLATSMIFSENTEGKDVHRLNSDAWASPLFGYLREGYAFHGWEQFLNNSLWPRTCLCVLQLDTALYKRGGKKGKGKGKKMTSA